MADLFANNKKLQAIDLPGYEGNGDCLSKLPFEEIIKIKISKLQSWEQSEQNIINVIEKSKNLSTFKYETEDVNLFKALAINCRNLIELHLKLDDELLVDDLDSKLSQIFTNNRNLKSIKLDNFDLMTGECFLSLNENIIEEIELNLVVNIERDFLMRSLPNFTKLHSLEVWRIEDFVLVHFAECISLCSKLKRLAVVADEGVNKDFNLFTSSKNIEWLNVSLTKDQAIIYSFLDYMNFNLPELKYLDISGYDDDLLDCKFNLNCKMEKLEVLKISCQSKITGSGLGNFPNLKELFCEGCDNLEDTNLISMLKCARNLINLDVSECKKITNRVIKSANEETRKRTNNIVLKIKIESTKIKPDDIKNKSPLLSLI